VRQKFLEFLTEGFAVFCGDLLWKAGAAAVAVMISSCFEVCVPVAHWISRHSVELAMIFVNINGF
jgi:hypothetical protein